jgi:hypothetical protein
VRTTSVKARWTWTRWMPPRAPSSACTTSRRTANGGRGDHDPHPAGVRLAAR